MNLIIVLKKIRKIHLEKNFYSNIQEVHIHLKIVILKEIVIIFKKVFKQIKYKMLRNKNIDFINLFKVIFFN